MLRNWIAGHKPLLITVVSGAVVAALIATFAVLSTGYAAQRLELNDSAVWVSNGQQQVIGRANTAVLELNSVVSSRGTEIDVVQQGSEVLLFDRTNNTVDIVNPATSALEESAALPTASPEIYLTGDKVVIHAEATGSVWVLPFSELTNFDTASEPTLSLGKDSIATVTEDGIIFAFSTDAQKIYRVDARGPFLSTESEDVATEARTDRYSITSVGDDWALLNERSRTLTTASQRIELNGLFAQGETPVLQRSSELGDSLLVAAGVGLFSIPLDGAEPNQLVEAQFGSAVRPVVVDGCTFAAWTGGTLWRQCGNAEGEILALNQLQAGSSRMAFAVNGDHVLLADPVSGNAWAVQRDGQLIANWDDLILVKDDQQEVEVNDEDAPPELEKEQLPPVAVDDSFGARPGRASVLPVLLNDYDPNGDVLVISEVEQISESLGRLDIINSNQQLQLALAAGSSGEFSFGYTVSDGRGGSDQATVTVTVRKPSENSPPVQVRRSSGLVAEGNRLTTSVLGDWVDPDGDAIYLSSAVTSAPDQVSYRPEGAVIFQEGGESGELRSVAIVVSDGTAETTGTVSITVRAPGSVPIVADPFAVQTYAGQEITVAPLDHVRGGTGVIRLTGVPEKVGSTTRASLETGTFKFMSDQIRTHYLEYVVTDGDQSTTGTIRIDVAAPPDTNSKPITVPKTVFVQTLSSETVRVATTDIDPSGGVLMVTGVDDVPVSSGVRAEVLEQRAIRVTLTAPLDSGTFSFGYRISNGLAESTGVVTVVELPSPDQLQAPVATDDSISVRIGDAIDIPVLDNDLHPDGEDLTLNPELISGLKSGTGLLFASGNKLRYLAPKQTGNFTAVYEISGPDGQVAQAQVRIAVREPVEATNAPPVPGGVTARVVAGEKVNIRIPLSGTDPDGDSVQLLGQESSPEKGSVSGVGTDFIEYEAGGYSAGTDSFTYTLIDSLGARATGTVRVGISPPEGIARNPVANPDVVRIRPGGTVSVQVLANDSDPESSELTVISVEPNSADIFAEFADNIVTITPPGAEGRYGLVYTIENESGGTSSNFITVEVDPGAPFAYPVARDTVLTLTDILNRTTIDVDVLRNVFFADGAATDLSLGLLAGYSDSITITDKKRVQVTVGNESQIIPFSVTHPDDPTIVSYAFVWVPGLDDALPQLDRRAKPLAIPSESTLRIELDERVIAIGDKPVLLTDSTTVRATHSNGDNLVVDDNTLKFTSADKYFGPASISFEVTDGTTADDPEGRKATLVLPITVTPRENQPPVFAGGVIEFEPGQEKQLDLLKLTTYPYPDDLEELTYSVLEPLPLGFDYSLSERTLTIRAKSNARKGSITGLSLGVKDDLSVGQAGRITLNVVASSRPLAVPAPDNAIVPRNKTTVVNVLANDEATNPFPSVPLQVVDIRGLDGGNLPEGITVVPSADRSQLSVTVSSSALPVDTRLQYQVADATNDPDRRVWGSVTLSVQDVPDAPVAPTRAVSTYENGTVTLRLTAPAFNNSAISGYRIVSSSNGGNYSKDCGLQLRCELTDLAIGSKYEFRVIATNAIGDSASSPASAPISADYLPAAVSGVTVVPTSAAANGGSVTVSWASTPTPSPGTPIVGYTVRISGPGVDASISVGAGATSLTDTTAGGALVANESYSVVVFARNSAQATDSQWNRSSPTSVHTVGPPPVVTSLTASIIDVAGNIKVGWLPSSWNGATSGTYSIGRVNAGDAVPSTCDGTGLSNGVSPATSGWIDSDIVDGGQYVYIVYADNGLYCRPTIASPVTSKTPPGQATGTATADQNGTTGQFDVKVGALAASGTVGRYQYQLNNSGNWHDVVNGQWLTSAGNASVYGAPQSVNYRACRDTTNLDFCGAESPTYTATPINTRGAILTCQPSSPPLFVQPANPGSTAATYSYEFSYLDSFQVWSSFAFGPHDPVPMSSEGIRIRSTVSVSGNNYVDPGYGEDVCPK